MNKANRGDKNSSVINRMVKSKKSVKKKKDSTDCNGVMEDQVKESGLSTKSGKVLKKQDGSKHLTNGSHKPSTSSVSKGGKSYKDVHSSNSFTSDCDSSETDSSGGKNNGDKGHFSSSHDGIDSNSLQYHCSYCSLNFSSQDDLQLHCRSQEHQTTIMSDAGREWQYRPPPRGLATAEYKLCNSVEGNSSGMLIPCRMGEQCIGAHSAEELAEWRERFDYRAMKLQRAKENQLHGASYADQLLDKLSNSAQQHLIVTDKVS